MSYKNIPIASTDDALEFDPTSTSKWQMFVDYFDMAKLDGGAQGRWMVYGPSGFQQTQTDNNRYGVLAVLITSTIAYSAMHNNGTGYMDAIMLGDMDHDIGWAVKVSELATGTEDWTGYIGIADTHTIPADGVYFWYDRGTDGANWQVITKAAGATTKTDTGIAVTTDFANLRFVINTAGTSVAFYIDGSLVATHTTNIPTGSDKEMGHVASIRKVVLTGATTPGYHLDTLVHKFKPGTGDNW